MVESRVTDAMVSAAYGVIVDGAVTEISDVPIDTAESRSVFHRASEETDRSTSILIFAYIDDCLRKYLRLRMDEAIRGGLDPLFTGFGILSTAHSRLTLAGALRWISPKTLDAINLIRRIRNEFAHRAPIRFFSDEPVKGLVHSIEKIEDIWLDLDEIKHIRRPLSDRDVFLARAAVFAGQTIHDLVLLPTGAAHRVSPRDVTQRKPQNLDSLQKAFIQTAL
jgi:hypothetical protein